jgi:hypothetical protein
VLSGISVKDLEGETNGMYAVKAGKKILKSRERMEKEEWGVKGDREGGGGEASKKLQCVFMVQ